MSGDSYRVTNIGSANAIGPRASVSVRTGAGSSQLDEVARRLADLRELVADHANDLDDAETARAALDAAEQEVRSGRPGRLGVFLSAVLGVATQVPVVAAAVQAIRDLLAGSG